MTARTPSGVELYHDMERFSENTANTALHSAEPFTHCANETVVVCPAVTVAFVVPANVKTSAPSRSCPSVNNRRFHCAMSRSWM